MHMSIAWLLATSDTHQHYVTTTSSKSSSIHLPLAPGDWERVSVVVCPGTQQVVAALFSQHNFDQLVNCTAGECSFEAAPQVRV